MFRRATWLLVWLCLLIPALAVYAQAPESINSALDDLSRRVGRLITLADLDNWTFAQSIYPDGSLGCPQPGQMYAQVQTSGMQFLLTYGGTIYDYRVSSDRQIVILCGTTAAPVTIAPGVTCPPPDDAAYLPPRLSVGAQARVTADADIPNNVRQGPGQSTAKTGEIPPGGVFTVLDGPRCTTLDKLIWWQVDYNGLVGWTVEGQAGDYWLEPLDALAGTPVPTIVEEGGRITAANAAQLGLRSDFGSRTGAAALSPDGRRVAQAYADGSLTLFSTDASGASATYNTGHTGGVGVLVFGPEGRSLATGGQDGMIRIWDITVEGKLVQRAELSGHTSAVSALAFSPDGLLLASGGNDNSVRVWDAQTGAALTTLDGHAQPVTTVAFSQDARLLFSLGADGSARLWSIQLSVG